nr:MAG TPA: hypothetical protein [Caudoviricetes sp.]
MRAQSGCITPGVNCDSKRGSPLLRQHKKM